MTALLLHLSAAASGSAQAAADYLTRETDSQGAVRDDMAVLRRAAQETSRRLAGVAAAARHAGGDRPWNLLIALRLQKTVPYGVVCAALFLGGCATSRTAATAQTPEPIVERWRGLTVAAEHRCSPYHSDEYAYPQAVEDDIIQRLGGLFSPYTGEVFDSKGDTDIEHVVARSEAHDNGLCRTDAATRRAFSRDLLNLTLASPRVNRNQKGAKDAAEWQPDANQCWFAQTVVAVRRAYQLTIDRREADALDGILAGCSSTEILNFR